MSQTIRRTIYPEVRILDEAKGLVEYVASDETLDFYKEVIRVSGWKFTHFKKNAPFVDSHNYHSIENLIGNVIEFGVKGKQLIETVKWAKDTSALAALGWKLTVAGFLKAVSVGFWPTRMVSKWSGDIDTWRTQLAELNLTDEQCHAVYIEQEQVELSACILGANPNALAKAYKAEVLSDAELETFSKAYLKQKTVHEADDPADASRAWQRGWQDVMEAIQQIKKLI